MPVSLAHRFASRCRAARAGTFSIGIGILALAAAGARGQPVTLTPSAVVAGSPELLRIDAPDAAAIDASWLDRSVQFFRTRRTGPWFALAGVDVEAPTGPSTIVVVLHLPRGSTRQITQPVTIEPASYRTTTLIVAPEFVEPSADDLKQIEADEKIKQAVFAKSAARPLWHGSFRAPVRAAPTDSFGTRRTFNGRLDSIHRGMDFRARKGTVVRAGNSGVVVLARRLFYEGNCVVIDHGLGLFTSSMHLSRINVREGQRVAKGQRIGLSGATGRVTGPHLHWAVRWQGASLDPAKLLKLDLAGVH